MEEKKQTNKKKSNNKTTTNKSSSTKSSSGVRKYNKSTNTTKKKTSSNNGNKVNNKNNVDKIINDIEMFEKTNSYDIVFDDNRLKDKESLDFSFIDGKRKKKKAKEDIEILEVEEVDYKEEAKKIEADMIKEKKNDAFSTSIIIIFSFILGFLICFIWSKESNYFKVSETIIENVEKVVVDDNYVFVGDSIFEGYDLDEFYEDMPVVNMGVSGNKTYDILKNMNSRIYRYNPSKVILLIGTNDIGVISSEETIENIGKIIDGIKENREYTEIYIQSIYPVNSEVDGWLAYGNRDNETIKELNKEIKKLCKEKNVYYMDLYDMLVDENGNLKEEYSYDGLHISKAGYEVITKEVKKVLK